MKRNNVKQITIRLTADEYAHVKQLSKSSGLKMEPAIRALVMGVNLYPRDHGGARKDLEHYGAALIWRTQKYLPSAQGWMTA